MGKDGNFRIKRVFVDTSHTVTLVRELQRSNAPLPMLVSLYGRLMEVIASA